MKKNKYDTAIVMLYLLGKEDLLPLSFRRQIPYSTVSTWRKEDYSTYLGHEFRFLFEENWDQVRCQKDIKRLKQLLAASIRAWLHLRNTFSLVIQQAKKDRAVRGALLAAIACLQGVLPLHRVLKLFGLSKALYHAWNAELRYGCPSSSVSICLKRHPNQLRKAEVDKMRRMLTSPKWQHWPIVSIALLAFRNKNVVASLYTWYKYARLLGITHKAERKERKQNGLAASRPNEYLHVDTTYYALRAGERVFITYLMDNYSKMILGFSVSNRLSFEGVKEALQSALLVINTHPDVVSGHLVADGGRENHNAHIDAFLSSLSSCQLTKIRALKDIQFSNSAVEAIHRIIKGRYLRNRTFETLEGLRTFLAASVQDYNQLRPHYKHAPQTPAEVYFGLPLHFDKRERIKRATKNRIKKNLETNGCRCTVNDLDKCGKCTRVQKSRTKG